jgi:two-component system response regulator RegA
VIPEVGSRILLVDDDEILRTRLARAFADRGYAVVQAGTAAEAVDRFDGEVDLAILDLRMPDRSGLEVLRDLRARDPELPVVMLSAYGSIATAVDAVRLGALDFVVKPADADTILAAFGRQIGEAVAADTPSLARTEWEHIQRVLQECGGNISEAARRLRLHRRTLQRKLQKYPPRG